ncbi:MAG: hypothetical protein Unbinned2851contig1000_9 [Prokaryotic dsDNA virus sp.]|nr:MAG: hypothetical protein Unbinned2851contig1000_9 [Prokaryotic dsDNA virus sp.]|tara:strand:+ start:32909 stop:33169 length:261 start_codon:yes stop_codon:yes gene_type:complete
MRDAINDFANDEEDEIYLYEDRALDEALLGIALHNGVSVAAYDYDKLVLIRQRVHGMNLKEAEEWIETNTMREYGKGTPVIVWKPQ